MISNNLFKASLGATAPSVKNEIKQAEKKVARVYELSAKIERVILDEKKSDYQKQYEIININKEIMAMTQGDNNE